MTVPSHHRGYEPNEGNNPGMHVDPADVSMVDLSQDDGQDPPSLPQEGNIYLREIALQLPVRLALTHILFFSLIVRCIGSSRQVKSSQGTPTVFGPHEEIDFSSRRT